MGGVQRRPLGDAGPASGEAVIRAEGLVKRYGPLTAVDGIDFEVVRGRFTGLLGPNGAGKSTTLRMLYQVTPPTAGRLELFGLPSGRRAREIKARMGVVPQMDNLDEELRVEQNLRLFGLMNGLSADAARARTEEMLAFTELAPKRRARVAELSGGMKRRLTLGRGLMNEPELVILDEPTTGLDPQVRQALWDKLARLQAQGITLLMSTHYMDEAERLCDELLIMDHGRIIARGTPRALIREHLPPQVLEVRLGPGDAERFERVASELGGRPERSGERASLFVHDGRLALQALEREGLDGERAYVRPSNLEDVFLTLTGRSLRE